MIQNGDVVRCKNGHEVCEVLQASLLEGRSANLWAAAFGNWRNREADPIVGGPMPVCLECGASIDWPRPAGEYRPTCTNSDHNHATLEDTWWCAAGTVKPLE